MQIITINLKEAMNWKRERGVHGIWVRRRAILSQGCQDWQQGMATCRRNCDYNRRWPSKYKGQCGPFYLSMYPVNFPVDHSHEEVLVKNYIITMESPQDMLPQLVLNILLKSFDLRNYIKMEKSLKVWHSLHLYSLYCELAIYISLWNKGEDCDWD